MSKKIVCILTCIIMMFGCAACGGEGGGSGGVMSLDDGKTRICLLINGNTGDMSFFDSANAGMTKFAADYPDVEVKILQMGTDNTKWEPTLRQTANEAYDLIIVGTTEMREALSRLAKNSKYSDRRFIIFDTEIDDNKAANYPTVHSMLFKQNEGGYLAGALAAALSETYGTTKTGFIGGMKIDIINDFGYGFMQGIKKANADKSLNTKAYNSFIGNFVNSPRGKTIADTFYSSDVNILFAAASQAGLGCLDSAKNFSSKNVKKYIIGVDSDQYEYFKNTDKAKADTIVTSVLKRVDLALYEACEKFVNGTLTYGDLQYLGIKEGKIGIADNENYQKLVPEEIRTYIKSLSDQIVAETLKVESGLKRYTSIDKVNALFDEMKP